MGGPYYPVTLASPFVKSATPPAIGNRQSFQCILLLLFVLFIYIKYQIYCILIRVVKADFLKAVREAVAQRLIKAVKRLLYVVNKTNDCFKMHLTSVRLWASTFHY